MNRNPTPHRECHRRDCGNNSHRKINPRDYDSVMGFLCDACEDDANDPRCPLCDVPQSRHGEPCQLDDQDSEN